MGVLEFGRKLFRKSTILRVRAEGRALGVQFMPRKGAKKARKDRHGSKKAAPKGRGLLRFFAVFAMVALAALILIGRTGKLIGPVMRSAPLSSEKSVREEPPPATAPAEQPAPKAPERRIRVAIIIDDMGNDSRALDALLGIDAPVAVAVLPMLAHSAETAVRAEKAGREVLLHLPMQPREEGVRGLGPGALTIGMSDGEIREAMSMDFKSVPGAVGVNNHMGSALTEDEAPMAAVMEVLKKRGLFFVDSRTTPSSVADAVAREKGVKAEARDVFLDDSEDPADIKRQFDRLVALARKNGEAVAIGHPRAATLAMLKCELPALKEGGIEVVNPSELAR